MNNKILVTGGAGFIGSNLCRRLLEEGNSVVCLDNLFCASKDKIEPLLSHPDFKFIYRSVEDQSWWYEIGTADQIYNLACPASPVHYQYDMVQTIMTSML